MTTTGFSDQASDGVQGALGSPHFTYFWQPLQLSFVWNGMSEAIDVCHGGYGEPVSLHLPSFVAVGMPAEVLGAFRDHCVRWMKDPRTWDRLVEAGIADATQTPADLLP